MASPDAPVLTKQRMLQQQAMSFLSKGVNTGQWDEHVAYDLVRQMLDANWQSVEPSAPIDAGLRFSPVLSRNTSLDCGWEAEMEQAHDGEWVHVSALNRPAKP